MKGTKGFGKISGEKRKDEELFSRLSAQEH
jgi:hypothetical protein